MNRMAFGVQSSAGHARVMSRHDAAEDFAPDISVVIATRGRPRELVACLESLEKQTYYDFEIVVVDSAPPDGDDTNLEIAKKFNAHYLSMKHPGSSRARNEGAREANAPIVAFTDDDALPEPDWLSQIYEEMKDEKVATVVGKTEAIPSETEAAKLFERLGGFVNGGTERLEVTRDTASWFPLVAFHGLGMLANMAVRRSFFLRAANEGWNGFNLRLGRGSAIHGYDENHALFSLVQEGNKVVYSPAVMVRHSAPASMEEIRNEMKMNRSASATFFCLLAIEYPRCWGQLIQHLRTKLLNTDPAAAHITEISFSLSERVADRLRGVGWYLIAVFGF